MYSNKFGHQYKIYLDQLDKMPQGKKNNKRNLSNSVKDKDSLGNRNHQGDNVNKGVVVGSESKKKGRSKFSGNLRLIKENKVKNKVMVEEISESVSDEAPNDTVTAFFEENEEEFEMEVGRVDTASNKRGNKDVEMEDEEGNEMNSQENYEEDICQSSHCTMEETEENTSSDGEISGE